MGRIAGIGKGMEVRVEVMTGKEIKGQELGKRKKMKEVEDEIMT